MPAIPTYGAAVPTYGAPRLQTRGTMGNSVMTFRPGSGASMQRPQDLLSQFMAQAEQARGDANAANEARFKEILGGLTARRDRVLGDLNLQGQTAKADLERTSQSRMGKAMADLQRRGLGRTTIAGAQANSINRDRDRALADIDERIQRQRAGLDAQLDMDRLAFMERREDVAPPTQFLASLAQQFGASGAMTGGGGGSGGRGRSVASVMAEIQAMRRKQKPGLTKMKFTGLA